MLHNLQNQKNILMEIHELSKEVNKNATLINAYCQFNIQNEQIYNITSITKILENSSEILSQKICDIINSLEKYDLPNFIKEIPPLSDDIIDIDY